MNEKNYSQQLLLSLTSGKRVILLFFIAIASNFTYGQLGPCPTNNNTAPPFTTADALNPNYGATLEVTGASLINTFPSFCVDDDPSDGKATEGGCATFLFTGLGNEDSCQGYLYFRPREGCSPFGDPPRNICMWQEDPNNPGQWLQLGTVQNEIFGDAFFSPPVGATEFSITLCGPNANSSVLLWGIQYDIPNVDIGPDTSLCSLAVPLNIDLTLHEPLVGWNGFNQTGGRWEEIGVGTILSPDNYPINGSLGDSFSFIYTFEETQYPDCFVKDTIVYTISNDCPGVPQVNLSGTSTTWNGESVDNVTYTALNANEQSLGSPNYSLTLFSGGNEDLKAERNADPIPLVGITTLDILLTRAHILQSPLLSNPYQLLAADVNASGNISTADYLQMQAMILQNITAFQPGNRLWSFMSSDYSFSDPANPWSYDPQRHYTPLIAPDKIEQDFIGIKLGDVNGNWTASNGNRTGGISSNIFSLEDTFVEPGSRIRIPIAASSFEKLMGYQFTLEWDSRILHFEQVNSRSLVGDYGYNEVDQGYLKVLWYEQNLQEVSFDLGEVLFEVEFTVLGEQGSSSILSIGSASLPAEAYNGDWELLTPLSVSANVQVGQTTSLDMEFEGYKVGLAKPNPFSDKTILPFILPKGEVVEIFIYNSLGQGVWMYKNIFSAGEHEISWDRKDTQGRKLPGGIYHINIHLGGYTHNIRLVVQD